MDHGFDAGVDGGYVRTLALQPDEKILVGGGFTKISWYWLSTRFARLLPSGSGDAFIPGLGESVFTLALQPDGKIVLGGHFTGPLRLLGDGGFDGAWPGTSRADGDVWCLGLQADGKILVGGEFTTLAGQPRSRIGRLLPDGTLDAAFNPGANGVVYTMAVQTDGRILVGGRFTTLGGESRAYVGRLNADGSLDPTFNPGANNGVLGLAIQADGKIMVTGTFTILGTQPRSFVGRLTSGGAALQSLTVDETGTVVTWTRSGTGPEIEQATLELSSDGTSYGKIRDGQRIVGGWRFASWPFPFTQTFYLRARGRTIGGLSDGSSGLIESVRQIHLIRSANALLASLELNPGPISPSFDPAIRSYTATVPYEVDSVTIRPTSAHAGATISVGIPMSGDDIVSSGTLSKPLVLKLGVNPLTVSVTAQDGKTVVTYQIEVTRVSLPPTVVTLPATTITASSAMVNGTVNPRGLLTSTFFEWGTNPSYGHTTSEHSVSGDADVTQTIFLPGLDQHTTYHFRFVAENSAGTTYGQDQTFTTLHGAMATEGFALDVNGPVRNVTVQADGKILFGGDFTAVDGFPRHRIARLNPDGVLDASFDPDASFRVHCVAQQPDGKILVGGEFTLLGGVAHSRIGRLEMNGAPDPGFNVTANGPVRALALQPDGKILLAGTFTAVGGQTRLRIARLHPDGTLDSLNPGANGSVEAIALLPDGQIVVGGLFTALGGQSRERIGRLNADGTVDGTFNPGAGGFVFALAVQPDWKILVGGAFTTLAGQTCSRIGRLNLDGSLDEVFNPGANDEVAAVSVQPDGKILVAGNFTTLQDIPRQRIARLHPDGEIDLDFHPEANARVSSVAPQTDGAIVVGGEFTALEGQPVPHLGRILSDGNRQHTFDPGANEPVWGLAVQPDDQILVGGSFTALDGKPRDGIGRLNPDGNLDAGFAPELPTGAGFQCLTLMADGRILIGGSLFRRLTADGQIDPTFTLEQGVWGGARSFAVQPDGRIVVAGSITIKGQSCTYLGRVNTNDTLDATFHPLLNSLVRCVAVQSDGKILLGGDFTSVNGQVRTNLTRLLPDGGLDAGFTAATSGGSVMSIALQADGKILLAGGFWEVNSQRRWRLGRLFPDGSLDESFAPPVVGDVSCLALQTDGRIVVGGWFTQLAGVSRKNLGRLNPDGTLDNGFNPGANGYVASLALQADGKLLVGGDITTLDGQPRDRIGRLTTDTAALQSLNINQTGTTATWLRSGAGPEIDQVVFEASADGTHYEKLGDAARIVGGWQITGLSLPFGQAFTLRARGRTTSGYNNGSSGLIESVRRVYLVGDGMLAHGVLEMPSRALQLSLPYRSGVSFTALVTTNIALPMSEWTVLGPATEVAPGRFRFTDPDAANRRQSFYRLRVP
ncbi:MAG TPA: cadherin-like beta sandwich domain-containing protein [Verrucomicrobiota bacterium]|nr:cadherin-like beta sandwich domain-containing protein [Verrucomicrobiota bacterium]HNU51507.1 cadherin-like beta sandwich domain-containing protein [Verrucomicrobiota bacterium]